MQSNDSSHGVVNCVSSDIRGRNIAIHVEVYAVTANDSGLSAVSELGVSDVAYKSIFSAACKHQMRTIVIGLRFFVSHHLDIPGEQTHFSSHL